VARKTNIQKLWEEVDSLQVLLSQNPHVLIEECRALILRIEEQIINLRKRELKSA